MLPRIARERVPTIGSAPPNQIVKPRVANETAPSGLWMAIDRAVCDEDGGSAKQSIRSQYVLPPQIFDPSPQSRRLRISDVAAEIPLPEPGGLQIFTDL